MAKQLNRATTMKLSGTDRRTDRWADSGQDHVLSLADILTKQAGAVLGQAQLKLGLYFTSINLH